MPSIGVRRHTSSNPWTYLALDQEQREIADRVRAGGPGALLLSEVAPVITLGRRTSEQDILLAPELLKTYGIELHRTDRGGLATYHGPGQWVLFVVDQLETLTGDRRGVRRAVEGLLEVALDVGREYFPQAEIRRGCEMGVWTPQGKIAALGVHIERGILLHGISVNGFRTLTSFVGLRPCGLDAPVGYLLSEQTEFDHLGQKLVEAALRRFWRGAGGAG